MSTYPKASFKRHTNSLILSLRRAHYQPGKLASSLKGLLREFRALTVSHLPVDWFCATTIHLVLSLLVGSSAPRLIGASRLLILLLLRKMRSKWFSRLTTCCSPPPALSHIVAPLLLPLLPLEEPPDLRELFNLLHCLASSLAR